LFGSKDATKVIVFDHRKGSAAVGGLGFVVKVLANFLCNDRNLF